MFNSDKGGIEMNVLSSDNDVGQFSFLHLVHKIVYTHAPTHTHTYTPRSPHKALFLSKGSHDNRCNALIIRFLASLPTQCVYFTKPSSSQPCHSGSERLQ